jgi:CubicO group peptidase (beta-lactamase class C family)
LHQKLWSPLGAECDAFWIVEGDGREWAAAGLNATLRDTARLGVLYAQEGVWAGERLVPAEWIRASRSADAPHLVPGYRERSASPFGYGYQWWLPDDSGAFCGMGIYNQFVYIDPQREVVIAKFSANRDYGSSSALDSFREREHFAFFRAICRRCE